MFKNVRTKNNNVVTMLHLLTKDIKTVAVAVQITPTKSIYKFDKLQKSALDIFSILVANDFSYTTIMQKNKVPQEVLSVFTDNRKEAK